MSDYICEELICEILTRLPSKSLLRFRSVSKSWYSCIGSPSFIRMYNSRSPQKFLIEHKQYKSGGSFTLYSEDQLPFRPGRGYIGITPTEFACDIKFSNIIGSCNGIICLSDSNIEHFSLWNPSIRRKLIVPDCPRKYCYGVEIGFGFDRITDDYKIVIIPRTGYEGNGKSSFVYSMKMGTWCVIPSLTPLIFKVKPEACFYNGTLHWVVEPHCRCIMTFDLSTHVFGTIDLPKLVTETIGLTTIQGSLALISFCNEHDNSWIWVRRYATWSVVFKSKINHIDKVIIRVLELSSNGDLLFKTHGDGLQVYNPKRGSQPTVVCSNAATWLYDIVLCAESLQLLDMGTAC